MSSANEGAQPALETIRHELHQAWAKSAEPWLSGDPRIPVIALARAIDLDEFGTWSINRTLRESGCSPRYSRGWLAAHGAFVPKLDEWTAGIGTPLFRGDDDTEAWGTQTIRLHTNLATINFARRLDSSSASRFVHDADGLERSAANFYVPMDALLADLGYWDDMVSVRRTLRDHQRPHVARLASRRPKVLKAMRDVTSAHDGFPMYGSTTLIEEWYRELGRLIGARMVELSVISPTAAFGGITFERLVDVVSDEIGVACRHLDHCALLRQIDPSARMGNLLTITQDCDVLTERWRLWHAISTDEAEQIRGVLTMEGPARPTSARGEDDESAPPPLPLFIRTSANQHLRLLTGILSEPFRYLHRRLAEKYPNDWREALRGSEADFAGRLRALIPTSVHRPTRKGDDDATVRASFANGEELRIIASLTSPSRRTASRQPSGRFVVVAAPADSAPATMARVGEGAVCTYRWFMRTALSCGPEEPHVDRLWAEARGERAQLRREAVTAAIPLGGSDAKVTLWTDRLWPGQPVDTVGGDVDQLRVVLRNEEEALVALGRGVDLRWVLTLLLSEADSSVYSADVNESGNDRARDAEESEQLLCAFGLPRALSAFLESTRLAEWPPEDRPPVVAEGWANAVAKRAGRLAVAEQALALVTTGLATLERSGASEWIFHVPAATLAVEDIEREHWYQLVERLSRSRENVRARIGARNKQLSTRLAKYVRLTPDRELSIKLPRNVQAHFLEAAIEATREMIGADSFPGDVLFNGIAFDAYRSVLLALAYEALVRVGAAESMMQRDELFDAKIMKTTGWRIPVLASSIAGRLHVDVHAVHRIIRAIALDPAGAALLRRNPRAPMPPLLRTADDHVLMSTRGCLDEPFYYLLLRLRNLYQRDWDAAVDSREAVFRDELYRAVLGDESERFWTAGAGINLRDGGQVLTDIDAVVFDRETGELGLFQLKWQDPFGASLTRRASVAKNFAVSAERWVQIVGAWVRHGSDDVLRRLGSPDRAGVVAVRLFVLGRFASHFSDQGRPNADAAWGTWPQVINLIAALENEEQRRDRARRSPLAWLDTELRASSPFLQTREGAPVTDVLFVAGARIVLRRS